MTSVDLQPEDITQELDQHQRDAVLDLVLAWGTLDSLLGALLSRILNIPFVEGAEIVGRLPSSTKLNEIAKLLAGAPDGRDASRVVRKHKRSYEKHSRPRNRIAHSHCAGYLTRDPEYLAFAAYEKEGDGLLVELVPLEVIGRATRWAGAMAALALRLIDAPHEEKPS